jgi:sulfur carrier protein
VKLLVNGAELDLERGVTVADLVPPDAPWIAVAVDGEVVPRGEWEFARLRDGQRIEILEPKAGG